MEDYKENLKTYIKEDKRRKSKRFNSLRWHSLYIKAR